MAATVVVEQEVLLCARDVDVLVGTYLHKTSHESFILRQDFVFFGGKG